MAELPSGTLTMLFSDIEGSTQLLTRLGPTYLEALEAHRSIMRAASAEHGGTEVGTEGDSFFLVFPTAGAAVRAATTAQRRLEGHPWPGGQALQVRMGIHTGVPRLHQGDYWGMDVHRAARIAASAHGGQVVVSSTTADLAEAELPDGVTLRDLGMHHLKDIPEPERLYQLVVEGLEQDFPSLRTLGTSSSLPRPATPLLGRQAEVDEVVAFLTPTGGRLVTLTGAGGAGKTRLAIAAAHRVVTRFPDGVFFVPLAAVTTAAVMWTSVAETLDVPAPERTPERLLDLLARRSLLLVLDNLEQVAGADEVVGRILDAAPQVTVIATSRLSLGLGAELRYTVAPLSLPEQATLASAAESGAVQLFLQRARTVWPWFELTEQNLPDVVALCRRLDGLPLAIELCAARIRLLTPKALLGRLDEALDITSTDRRVSPRQRTLRDTIAWSYELLSSPQQAFFRRLGVFAGGADLEAIAAVALPDDGSGRTVDPLGPVAELVDASLADIPVGPDGEPRVTLLQTIRAFARDELRAAGEMGAARTAHAQHYADRAERLRAMRQSRHRAAQGLAETDMDNFREALDWVAPQPGRGPSRAGDVATALRLCVGLSWLWVLRGYLAEGRQWTERVIARAAGSPSPQLAALHATLANLLLTQGQTGQARDAARESLAMARAIDDPAAAAYALGVLGTAELHSGDLEAARGTLTESLRIHRRLGDESGQARVLGHLAGIEENLGNFDEAERLTRESLAILDRLGDAHESAIHGQNLANLLAVAGRVEEAAAVAQGLIDPVLVLHSPTLTMAFANTYMNILLRLGDPVRAAQLFGAEEAMHDRVAIPNPFHDEELEEALELVAGEMSAEEWDQHRRVGRGLRVEELLEQLRAG